MISPCGMICEKCIRHRALHNSSLQTIISEKKNIPLPETSCSGCSIINRDGVPEKTESNCRIFQCCSEKKIRFCYECDIFPCDAINPSNGIINDELGYYKIINLSILKENGTEKLKTSLERTNKFHDCIPVCPCLSSI